MIQALRTLSQKLGFFVESEKGRQQLALKGANTVRKFGKSENKPHICELSTISKRPDMQKALQAGGTAVHDIVLGVVREGFHLISLTI